MQAISLGGYTFPWNPSKNVNPKRRALAQEVTFGGSVFTDYGYADSDRQVEMAWDQMPKSFYDALDALQAPGTLAYTDEWGVAWTVYVVSLVPDGYTPQGDAYTNVRLTLAVVSQP